MRAVVDELVDECDELADEIDFQEIREDLLVDEFPYPCREERIRINDFCEKFDATIMKQYETMGGYVLDYNLYTTIKHGKLKDKDAIELLENVYDERELFRIEDISEVELKNGKTVSIPDYHTHIVAKIMINKRDEGDLLEWAKPRLNLSCEFDGNANELGRDRCYILKLDDIQQFCQVLNYIPYVKLLSCECGK
jgi:hypothetical protein